MHRKILLLVLIACALLTGTAHAQTTYSLQTLTLCGSCDDHRFALNFEGDGSDAGGITLNVTALALFENPKTGVWEGRGTAELLGDEPSFPVLIRDHAAEFVVRFAPSGAGPSCPSTDMISDLVVRGVGAAPGEHFEFRASGSVTEELMGCPGIGLVGQLVLGKGAGAAKKASWGSLKDLVRQ